MFNSVSDIVSGIREKKFTPVEVLDFYYNRISRLERKVQAFISLKPYEELKQEALSLDKSHKGKLLGVPVAVKDNINIRGFKTTCASRILPDYYPPYNATVIEHLKREGAIFIGKTNMDEFAFGSSTENSSFHTTLNPYDLTRVPGGSSGGSAAAVSSRMVALALGSDTGGSIRQPASFCGVVGVKPTYGRVSRKGLVAFASSLDQIGPLSVNIEDSVLLLEVISGYDPGDSTTVKNQPSCIPSDGFRNLIEEPLTIGYSPALLEGGVEEEVVDTFYEALELFKKGGFKLKEIELPYLKYGLSVYYILGTAEASSNLARFDGIRYGLKHNSRTIKEMVEKVRGEGFGPEVRRRILLGTFALSSGFYEDYYIKACKVRALIQNDFFKAFQEVDMICLPTSPDLPFLVGSKSDDPLKMYKADLFTIPINLAGLPALNLPFNLKNGLPVGVQLIGRPFEEATIFQGAMFLERERGPFTPPAIEEPLTPHPRIEYGADSTLPLEEEV